MKTVLLAYLAGLLTTVVGGMLLFAWQEWQLARISRQNERRGRGLPEYLDR